MKIAKRLHPSKAHTVVFYAVCAASMVLGASSAPATVGLLVVSLAVLLYITVRWTIEA